MKTKIKQFFIWMLLTLLRTSIVLLGYSLYIFTVIAEYALLALAWIGKFLGVDIQGFDNEPIDMTQKFTVRQIEDMAEKVKEDETIEQIQERLDVSYRQARKIKLAQKNRININTYQPA